MDEDVFGKKRKKKSSLTPSEALYKSTLETIRSLDFGTQIYNTNLFETYGPPVQANENQSKEKNTKSSTRTMERYPYFQTDVGLGKPPSLTTSQSQKARPPLKVGTSRTLSASPMLMEKLGISLVKPITSFGHDEIFVPSPFKRTKLKKRKRNRKKKTIKNPELQDTITTTSEDVVDIEVPMTQDKNISEVDTSSPDSLPNISIDEIVHQKRLKKSLKSSQVEEEIIKSEKDQNNNEKSIQNIEKKQEKVENEVKLPVKGSLEPDTKTELSKKSDDILQHEKSIPKAKSINLKETKASSIQAKAKKSKSKKKKEKLVESNVSTMEQKTSELKTQDSARGKATNTETTPEKTRPSSHPRKQVTPQKNNNPGLKLLRTMSEGIRNGAAGSSVQRMWDRTARPRFNINLQPITPEVQNTQTKISDTKTTAEPSVVPVEQQVLVKIQSTGTKVTRPSLNIEMQSVSSEINISMDKETPEENKSLPSETKKKGFRIPKELLQERIPITTKLESPDRNQRPRPSYSTQGKPPAQVNKPQRLTYEEITSPEVIEALKAKESELPPTEKDSNGQPILRLRMDSNLPEPRPRRNMPNTKPLRGPHIDIMTFQNTYSEKHTSRFKTPWKKLSYMVESTPAEQISARERISKLLPHLKEHKAKARKLNEPNESPSSEPPKFGSSTTKKQSPVKLQPTPPKITGTPIFTSNSETFLPAPKLDNVQSEFKSRKFESSPSKSSKEDIKSKLCTESEVINVSVPPTPGPSAIRSLETLVEGIGKLPSSTSISSRIRELFSPTPGPSGMHRSATSPEPKEIVTSASSSSSPKSDKTYTISANSPRHRKRSVQFRKSSESSESPPWRKRSANRKCYLPRHKKQMIEFSNLSCNRSDSSVSPKSITLSQYTSDIRKKELISTRSKTNIAKPKLTFIQDKSSPVTSLPDRKGNNTSTLASPSSSSNGNRKNPNLKKLPFTQPQTTSTRKLSRKLRNMQKQGAIYDKRGIHIESGKDLCDCLSPNCEGCFSSCSKCRSTKCGINCRVNRKFLPDDADFDEKHSPK